MSVDELKEQIDDKILYEIIEYCELNGKLVVDIINKTLKDSITIMKYGDKPPMFNEKPKSEVSPMKQENITNAENTIIKKEVVNAIFPKIEETSKSNKRKLSVK